MSKKGEKKFKDPMPLLRKNKTGELVKLINKDKVDLNWKSEAGTSLLQLVILHCPHDTTIAEALIKKNNLLVNQLNKSNMSPLHAAVLSGNGDLVSLLIKNGANINQQNNKGLSPLHTALQKGEVSIIKILIDNKADLNLKDNTGSAPLHMAIVQNNDQAARMLIMGGADVNLPGKGQWSPLHFAASKGKADLINLLLSCNANIESTDQSDHTPLHIAVASNSPQAVYHLLQQGAAIDKMNKRGIMPLQLSRNPAITRYFAEFGCILFDITEEEFSKIPQIESIDFSSILISIKGKDSEGTSKWLLEKYPNAQNANANLALYGEAGAISYISNRYIPTMEKNNPEQFKHALLLLKKLLDGVGTRLPPEIKNSLCSQEKVSVSLEHQKDAGTFEYLTGIEREYNKMAEESAKKKVAITATPSKPHIFSEIYKPVSPRPHPNSPEYIKLAEKVKLRRESGENLMNVARKILTSPPTSPTKNVPNSPPKNNTSYENMRSLVEIMRKSSTNLKDFMK